MAVTAENAIALQRDRSRSFPLRGWILCALATFIGLGGLLTIAFAQATFDRQEELAQRANTIRTARNYQLALDLLLQSGDEVPLRSLFAEGFRDEHPAAGFAADANGVLELLNALRVSIPGLEFHSAVSSVDGEIATLDINAKVSGTAWFPAIPGVPESREWKFAEMIRVEHGRIIQRWGAPLPFPLQLERSAWHRSQPEAVASIDATEVKAARITSMSLVTERIWTLVPVVVAIESGSLHLQSVSDMSVVRSTAESPSEAVRATKIDVSSGDLIFAVGTLLLAPQEPVTLTMVTLVDPHEAVPEGDLQAEEFYARPLGPDGFVQSLGTADLMPLVEIRQSQTPRVISMDRVETLLPQGGDLPRLPANAVQIITVSVGELTAGPGLQPFRGGDQFIRRLADDLEYTLREPTRVTILTITFDSLE